MIALNKKKKLINIQVTVCANDGIQNNNFVKICSNCQSFTNCDSKMNMSICFSDEWILFVVSMCFFMKISLFCIRIGRKFQTMRKMKSFTLRHTCYYHEQYLWYYFVKILNIYDSENTEIEVVTVTFM